MCRRVFVYCVYIIYVHTVWKGAMHTAAGQPMIYVMQRTTRPAGIPCA